MSLDPLNLMKYLTTAARHSSQIHGLNEADSEIVQINETCYLATTVDSIAEEISIGLYRDPYTMGWACAQASLSDLAAVGVSPVGLLFSTQWAEQVNDAFKTTVFQGFNDAVQTANTFLLGGDTGTTHSTVLTSVGLGISSDRPCTRVGMQLGDSLCITGKTGGGSALAFRFLSNEPEAEFEETNFRPCARIKEGKTLRSIATSMIDTSDGLLSALRQLQSVNPVGFHLEWNPNTLDHRAVTYCRRHQLPLWSLWVGEHGDFEILATIPQAKLQLAKKLCPNLNVIGQVVEKKSGVLLTIPEAESPTGFKQQKTIHLNFFQSIHSGRCIEKSSIAKQFAELVYFLKHEGFP